MSIVQSITMRATTACAVALFSCSLAFAQTQQVKGTVLDNLGEPLAGVNIVEKGTTNGTLTDIDGMDYQILIEADYIANASENGYSDENIRNFLRRICATRTGARLICAIFGVS